MSFVRNYAIDESFEKALDVALEVGCDGIEILAPKSLKKMITEKAESVINLYKK